MVFTCGNFFSGNGDNDDNDDNDDDDDDDIQVGTLEGTLFLQSGHLVRLSQQALVDCRYIWIKIIIIIVMFDIYAKIQR